MSSKKYINSDNWSSGAVSLTDNYLSKIHRSLMLNELDFFNLVKNKKKTGLNFLNLHIPVIYNYLIFQLLLFF